MQAPSSVLFRATVILSLLSSLAACAPGSVTQSGTPATGSTQTSVAASVSQVMALSSEQQIQLARSVGSVSLLDWAESNASASTETRQAALTTLLNSDTSLAAQIGSMGQGGGPGRMGPGGMPPGGMGPGGPGGMPNMAEIEANYPELAAALKALEGLSPEERRTQMDALLAAHPEWQAAFPSPPPGGMGGPGGVPPNGPPPSGFPRPAATTTP
ncbi:MAG: hypothetical protein ACO1RX_10735 [Candidatus Sericytochromatia bacterium]